MLLLPWTAHPTPQNNNFRIVLSRLILSSTFKLGAKAGLTPRPRMTSSIVLAMIGSGDAQELLLLAAMQTTASTMPDSNMDSAIPVTHPVH